jgi:hypothetical protein
MHKRTKLFVPVPQTYRYGVLDELKFSKPYATQYVKHWVHRFATQSFNLSIIESTEQYGWIARYGQIH